MCRKLGCWTDGAGQVLWSPDEFYIMSPRCQTWSCGLGVALLGFCLALTPSFLAASTPPFGMVLFILHQCLIDGCNLYFMGICSYRFTLGLWTFLFLFLFGFLRYGLPVAEGGLELSM